MNKKTVLVSGANRGMGFAAAKALLHLNYRVIATCRNPEHEKEMMEELGPLGEVHIHQLDITDSKSIQQIKEYVAIEFGSIDILINNAAILNDKHVSPSEVDFHEVRKTFDTNFFGTWELSNAFIPMMRDLTSAQIIHISSLAGAIRRMDQRYSAYGLSKLALNGLTIKMADELKNTPIQVNCISPGWVRTDMGGPDGDLSIEEGIDTLIWLCHQMPNGPRGKFFQDRKEIPY